MPILQRDVPDLNDSFDADDKLKQMVLELDLPEVQAEGISPDQARERAEAARQVIENLQEGAPSFAWLNDYFMLRDKGWPFRQAAYIAWASTPSDARMPKTQQELATVLGLKSDRVISTWRKRNPAILETIALMQSAALWTHRSDAFKSLIDGMKNAGTDYKFFNHLKLYLEMTGDYVPTSKFVANLTKKLSTDPSELNEDEIAILARAYEDYQARNPSKEDGETE
jgi:hypothetical protein